MVKMRSWEQVPTHWMTVRLFSPAVLRSVVVRVTIPSSVAPVKVTRSMVASGNDKITLASSSFSGVEGGDGSDKLTLGGAGWTLDAKSKSGSSLTGIETIDITGTGDNTIKLDKDAVLDASDSAQTHYK